MYSDSDSGKIQEHCWTNFKSANLMIQTIKFKGDKTDVVEYPQR